MLISKVITQVFPDEFHLHTLDHFLSATARLNPNVNVKAIVIGIMDRLSNYASREAEPESPEERIKKEEEATERLLAKLSVTDDEEKPAEVEESKDKETNGEETDNKSVDSETTKVEDEENAAEPKEDTESEKKDDTKQTKGIPEDIKLYEIFYEQVLNLVNVRAHTRQFGHSSAESRADFHVSSKAQNLPVQDIIALLVSLANLALKIYPERLGE